MRSIMRCLWGCFLISLLVCFCPDLFGQSKAAAIRGHILTKDHLPVEAATTVLLRLNDSTRLQSTTTNQNGLFQLSNLKPGKYLILISKPGFQKRYKGPFDLTAGSDIGLGDIEIEAATHKLAEVVIIDHKRYLEVKPDKTILNLNHHILTTGVSALDVLQNAPGIKMNPDGEISFHGGGKATIAINGKELKLDSRELIGLLGGLQTDNIDQIELISNPSAKYENAGIGGVINIILKKGQNDGLNGSLTGSIGYGTYYKSNAGGTWNYRNKNLNFFGGTTFGDNKNYRQINVERLSGNSAFNTYYHNTSDRAFLDYNTGADLIIDSTDVLGIYVKGSLSRYHIPKSTVSNIYTNGIPDSTLFTTSDIDGHISTVLADLNYSGRIGHTHQILSANADYMAYDRRSLEYIKSTSRPGDTTYYLNNPPFRVKNSSAKLDYHNPLSKTVTLEAGAKYSYLHYTNNQNFSQLASGSYRSGLYVSDFKYAEKISRGYLNVSFSGSRFSYRGGLSVEHTATSANNISAGPLYQINRAYTDFFPNLQVTGNVWPENQLQFVYDRRVDRPGYEMQDPTVAYHDRYTLYHGNPYLNPAYASRFKLSDTYKGKYLISLYYTSMSDLYNFTYFRQNDSSKVLTAINRNIKRKTNVGISVNIPFELSKWWNVNFTADASYFRFVDYKNLSNLDKGTQDIIIDLNQDFYLTKTLTAGIQGHFETATFYGIFNYNPVFYTNLAVSKRLSAKSTVTLNLWDITNGNFNLKTYTSFNNLNLHNFDKAETRYIRITYTCVFGKSTVKATRRHTTANSEEQDRLGED